jgi:hypothetical protein
MKAPNKIKLRLILALTVAAVAGAWISLSILPRNRCIYNLHQIDGAKEQWSLDTDQTNGAPAVPTAINRYIKHGEPKCPEGGTYTYGNVGEDPRCSIKGHELPRGPTAR